MADPASRTITAEERKEAAAQVETLRGTVSKDIAFIIERTKNKNVVVYEAQRDGEALKKEEAMVGYWLDLDPEYVKKARAAGKEDDRVDLNMFEKQFAYGLSCAAAEKEGEYTVNLVALPARALTLYLKEDGTAAARLEINGRSADLFKIFVDSTDRWVGPPKVNFVELYGDDRETGEALVERLHP